MRLDVSMKSFLYLLFLSHFQTPQPNDRKRLYEVHFPHNYVQCHPWGDTPHADAQIPLNVSWVSHVTHQEQATQIRPHSDQGESGHYHFKSHKKFGKSYIPDGRPLGESYRYTQTTVPDRNTQGYCYIPNAETVLPGYYSWWGLAVDQNEVPNLAFPSPPGYLKDPPESIYGTQGFSSSLHDLLTSYAISRGCGVHELNLKVGGTLRYTREIAYVVIICTSNDGVFENYNPINKAPHHVFNPNGLVNEEGKVVDITRVPIFTTHYVSTFSSYETLDFALYYEDGSALQLPVGQVNEFTIDAEHHRCTRTQPRQVNGITKWICPDLVQD